MLEQILLIAVAPALTGLFWLAYAHPTSFVRVSYALKIVLIAVLIGCSAYAAGWSAGVRHMREVAAGNQNGLLPFDSFGTALSFYSLVFFIGGNIFLVALENLHKLLGIERT